MLVHRRKWTVYYQHWYNAGKQLAQRYSNCGKNNFPIVDVQGLSSVYSALVVDCKIPAFVQCWVYNRSNLFPTVKKVIFRQWIYNVYPVSIQLWYSTAKYECLYNFGCTTGRNFFRLWRK